MELYSISLSSSVLFFIRPSQASGLFLSPRKGNYRPEYKHTASSSLKGQCHEDFAVLSQFCAKIITALIINKMLL